MTLTDTDLPPSMDVTIRYEGDILNPPHVSAVEANSVSTDERIVDACGNAETRQTSEGEYQLDISGLLLEPDKRLLNEMDLRNKEVEITQPCVTQQSFIVKDITISKTDTLNTAHFPNRAVTQATRERARNQETPFKSQAYEFTLQTKDPSNGSN